MKGALAPIQTTIGSRPGPDTRAAPHPPVGRFRRRLKPYTFHVESLSETPSSEPAPRTILIVDDMPANLGVLTSHLEREGYVAVVAQGGEEGIERAEFVRPDLILLDVMMPGLDGFETCRRLKANAVTRDIPVVFMTALADTDD